MTETIPKNKATDTEFYVGENNSPEYDQIKAGTDNEEEEEDFPEIEVIENPVVKRIICQFKKPVRLKFS